MTHVAVIGGGPAGLSAAACLAEHSVSYTLFERGDALAGLRRLDPEMQLLTPTSMSRLPGMDRRADPPYMRFGELVDEIDAWRGSRKLAVQSNAAVESVEPTDDGYAVHYRQGNAKQIVRATHVVNATGIIGNPNLPLELPSAMRWMHSVDVRSADLAVARRLLVVGAGMSAAEVLERWLELRGDTDRAWLSTRGRVRASPSKILGIDVHWLLWAPEHLRGRMFGKRLAPAHDLIIGRAVHRALGDRTVTRAPAIERYDAGAAVLVDGTRLDPDLIIYATGFRYAAEHLGELVERDRDGWPIVDRHAASVRSSGLYLLGLRFGRSIASPYLRGISRDAVHVARRIARS
jgi:putative flavoprotein involved in K+ transport